jgi:hypothetical protein
MMPMPVYKRGSRFAGYLRKEKKRLRLGSVGRLLEVPVDFTFPIETGKHRARKGVVIDSDVNECAFVSSLDTRSRFGKRI